jgi:hypothetical protein
MFFKKSLVLEIYFTSNESNIRLGKAQNEGVKYAQLYHNQLTFII